MAVSYESKRCNVLVLGVMGQGKSTVANKVLCHDHFSVSARPTLETKSVSCGERVIEGPGKVMYSVKVVDTMGFCDPQGNPEETVKAIQKFLQEEVVEGVSLVLFVTSERRMTEALMETTELIKKHFKQISPISALVITHCESLDDDAREEIVKEYKTRNDKREATVVEFMQKGIYTVGFPDLKMYKERLRECIAEQMEKDVKQLHEVIYQSTKMLITSKMIFGEEIWETVKQSKVLSSGSDCSIM